MLDGYTASLNTVENSVMSIWRPPDPLTVSQWAEAYRILSVENCALPGPYRVAVTPFLKDILDAITDPIIERIVCQKSAQIAWTDGVVNNAIGYFIDHEPSSILTLFPTESMAQRYSKEKLAPMIRDSPALRGRVAEPKSRDSNNTILSKNFKGGHLELVGSNSPVNLSSSPIRVVIIEEPDRCAANSGGEGNSLNLAIARTRTYFNRKIIIGGSPTIKGYSEIERQMQLTDQRRFLIPCPICGTEKALQWSMVVWDEQPGRNHPVFKDRLPETARIKCPHCRQTYTTAEKNKMLSAGRWSATGEFTGAAGFYLNELYSPFPKSSLPDIAARFLESKRRHEAGDPHLMITWINTAAGESWEEKGDGVEDVDLLSRVESFGSQKVAPQVLCITAAVDVQDDRLEMEVVGWGEGDESWSLDWLELKGDPEQVKVWQKLDKQLERRFDRDGVNLRIACTCIDSGAHTDAVYSYVLPRQSRRVYAVKGKSTEGDPVVTMSKRKKQRGLILLLIGTDTAKTVVMGRLKIKNPGPGYCHFPADRKKEYFEQLTSEELITRFNRGRIQRIWKKKRPRNEALDLRVYNLAALKVLNPNYKKLRNNLEAAKARIDLDAGSGSASKKPNRKSNNFRKKFDAHRKNFVKNY